MSASCLGRRQCIQGTKLKVLPANDFQALLLLLTFLLQLPESMSPPGPGEYSEEAIMFKIMSLTHWKLRQPVGTNILRALGPGSQRQAQCQLVPEVVKLFSKGLVCTGYRSRSNQSQCLLSPSPTLITRNLNLVGFYLNSRFFLTASGYWALLERALWLLRLKVRQ